ncbi:ammonium transporter [Curvibacter soli]|uniref:ammonium transporter n=1 Tax=Curvibacter soli TaxID=3031331 RepID=UPI003AEF41A1
MRLGLRKALLAAGSWGLHTLVWAQTEASAQAPAVAAAVAPSQPALVLQSGINGADTAWMIVATALVLLMTVPGLALFYAGMVRRKNVLNTMACVLAVTTLVTILWYAVGYSWAFTPGNGWIGGGQRLWFSGLDYMKDAGKVAVSHVAPNIPESVYSMFQLTFAIITPALIAGAFVERMRFAAMLWFIGLWSLFVYAPVAHWVWEPGGWLAQMGALDFAGGSVVHINAGIAGLVCAYVLGPRKGYGREPFEPFNLGFTMTGASLLWVGWFGFNAGSAVAADGRAGLAMAVTHIAAAAASLSWMFGEWVMRRRPSLLGMSSGVVAGLVAITPASGFVSPRAALVIGIVAGLACYWGATGLKRLLRADDSLDVFGVHGIGGIVGCILTGVFASKDISGAEGHVLVQIVDAGAVLIYSGVGTAVLLWVTKLLVGLRVDEDSELNGLDISQHRERLGG